MSGSLPLRTPILAKLHWYRIGGEVSEIQWRDVRGYYRDEGATNLIWTTLTIGRSEKALTIYSIEP